MDTPEIGTVRSFIEAINAHDVDTMFEMLTEDHVFVDALGQAIKNRKNLVEPWTRYFASFPDYEIVVTHLMQDGDVVGVFGAAGASKHPDVTKSLPGERWVVPAAWRAVVRGDRIAIWQVYADNEPVRKLVKSGRRSS